MFGSSKCPKCENSTFKLQEVSPTGSGYKFQFIQCTKCDSPVGVTEYFNISSMLVGHEKMLKKQSTEISDVYTRLQHVERIVVAIANSMRL